MSLLYLQRERGAFHGGRHVALPCFNSGPEQTNLLLVVVRAFCVSKKKHQQEDQEKQERVVAAVQQTKQNLINGG